MRDVGFERNDVVGVHDGEGIPAMRPTPTVNPKTSRYTFCSQFIKFRDDLGGADHADTDGQVNADGEEGEPERHIPDIDWSKLHECGGRNPGQGPAGEPNDANPNAGLITLLG